MRIEDVRDGEFVWTQPSVWKSRYVLTASGQNVAELQYQGFWQTHASITSANGCFAFAPNGFWQSAYQISACGSDQVLAVFHRSLWKGGGWLELPLQRELLIRANNWRSEISLTWPENDQTLVHCARTSIWKVGGRLTLQPGATFLQPLPLIVLVCWFAHVQQYRDQMTAVAAA